MKTRITLFLVHFLLPVSLLSENAADNAQGLSPHLLLIIYVTLAFLLMVTYSLWMVSMHLKKFIRGEFESEEQKMYDNRSVWEKIFQVKPVGTDEDVMMGHSYDGIRELDNPPPPWFMFLFYGTILFAVIYFVRFSITGDGPTQEEEYLAQLEKAQIAESELSAQSSFDLSSIVQLTDSEDIASGKAVYQKNCKLCHDEGGKGSTGPNLTDAYWKHGGGVMNIYNTITNGVPAKGMQSWAGQLSEEDILKVTSYILSLEGTDPPGAKAPEGDIWLPEESEDNIMTMTESDSL